MQIGIHIGAAFSEKRTGVEEYAYQLIKHLTKLESARNHQFILYKDPKINKDPDFALPENFKIKELKFPIFWTQLRLSYEISKNKPDVLFVPGNFTPLLKPKKTVVTIHGLEFKYFPKFYSFKNRMYLSLSTKRSVKNSDKIIAVSENTKKDIIKFYKTEENKISVIYHGVNESLKPEGTNERKYILYIGRLEDKKNVNGVIKAFEGFKKRYMTPHKLVLLGGKGHGYAKIMKLIEKSEYNYDIITTGYVSEEEKKKYLKDSEMLLSPSFYEGFGMPILEAQAMGVPTIVSNNSSMLEVAGRGTLITNPDNPDYITDKMYYIIKEETLRNDLIKNGFSNVEAFSWNKCAEATLKVLTE